MIQTVALRVASVSAMAAEAGAEAMPWLGEEESARLVAMGSQKRRRQFIAGHWLARSMVAERTNTSALDWLIVSAPGGAPECIARETGERTDLHLSISHSGKMVAVAVAAFPVGIDVESADRERDWLALADQIFSPEESEPLRMLSPQRRRDLFHRYWTLKEACGKRDGIGLRPEAARKHRACACDEADAIAITWQYDSHCVALAADRNMQIDARGIPRGAEQLFWRFAASEPAFLD